ncbi:MAG TPA: ABC transporter permease [Vicinamibacterales bacterium]|nr:ABC transporter permease [Vicinamibacterales bacterium]
MVAAAALLTLAMLQASPAILVSRQLAARAHLKVGDEVTLATEPNGGRTATFRVTGVYEPTPDPMRFTAQRIEARLHLPDLIALAADPRDPASAEAIGAINVALTDPSGARAFANDVASTVPTVVVRPAADMREGDVFAVIDRFHVAISIVTVVGATAFLLALMLIRAEERRETIAVLRLIGISQRSLLASVAVEGLVIATAGAIFGVALALASERLVNAYFQARYDTALVFIRVTAPLALRSVAVAAPLGVVAGIAASWTLLRRNILSLFRR